MYAFGMTVSSEFDTTVARVTAEPASEDFCVPTKSRVHMTLKEKLNVGGRPVDRNLLRHALR